MEYWDSLAIIIDNFGLSTKKNVFEIILCRLINPSNAGTKKTKF